MQPIVLVDPSGALDLSVESYSFKGANGQNAWPKLYGQGLGPCGMWNFLWRVGYHPQQLTIDRLPQPQNQSVLFVDKTTAMDNVTLSALKAWIQQGGTVVATGNLISWQSFLPAEKRWRTASFRNPYAGLAYIVDDYTPQIIAPSNWNFIECDTSESKGSFIGRIAAVQGERQTPHRATLACHQHAPAMIRHNSFFYLNGHPFAAFQAWLQGQENLTPWIAWRHRLFWLDEWVSFFCDFLLKNGVLDEATLRPGISHLKKTTIILRHDLDYSRDLSFLSEENKANINATYALLKDRNYKFWLNELRQFNNHEVAFHYNTGKRNWKSIIERVFTKRAVIPFIPHKRQIVGTGLLKQLKWAKRQGIDIQTIHRHLSYLIYPEFVDALDAVFESDLEVLGSSSLFRAQVLKWGIDRVDGHHGFIGEWPDAQFPVWYPFKLAHAGKNGKILNGWEMTSLMEVEPEMMVQMLDYNIKHIKQNIYTVIFHPAHALQNSLYQHGSLHHFQSLLQIADKRDVEIATMATVLKKSNSSQLSGL